MLGTEIFLPCLMYSVTIKHCRCTIHFIKELENAVSTIAIKQ